MSEQLVPLRRRGGGSVFLSASQFCTVVAAGVGARAWRMRVVGYIYVVRFSPDDSEEGFAWHWHPTTRSDHHLHVSARHHLAGDLSRLHIPAGPTSFASVVRFSMDELNVRP